MKTISPVMLLFAVIICFGCTGHTTKFEKGTLYDYSEIAGCDFIIKLDDGGNLEPLNLQDFDEEPEDGGRVEVKYVEEPSINSLCNAGTVVTLTGYRKLN
jgi:hypothetical protein